MSGSSPSSLPGDCKYYNPRISSRRKRGRAGALLQGGQLLVIKIAVNAALTENRLWDNVYVCACHLVFAVIIANRFIFLKMIEIWKDKSGFN